MQCITGQCGCCIQYACGRRIQHATPAYNMRDIPLGSFLKSNNCKIFSRPSCPSAPEFKNSVLRSAVFCRHVKARHDLWQSSSLWPDKAKERMRSWCSCRRCNCTTLRIPWYIFCIFCKKHNFVRSILLHTVCGNRILYAGTAYRMRNPTYQLFLVCSFRSLRQRIKCSQCIVRIQSEQLHKQICGHAGFVCSRNVALEQPRRVQIWRIPLFCWLHCAETMKCNKHQTRVLVPFCFPADRVFLHLFSGPFRDRSAVDVLSTA